MRASNHTLAASYKTDVRQEGKSTFMDSESHASPRFDLLPPTQTYQISALPAQLLSGSESNRTQACMPQIRKGNKTTYQVEKIGTYNRH